MKSMTGYGRAQVKTPEALYTIELSSVNSRYLEFLFRTPRHLSGLELKIRQRLQKRLGRGKISVVLNADRSNGPTTSVQFNDQAAAEYLKQIRAFQRKFKLAGEVKVTDLLGAPEVLRSSKSEPDDSAIWKVLAVGIDQALGGLEKMRAKEGKKLAADMSKRMRLISRRLAAVEKLSQKMPAEHMAVLRARVEKLLEGAQMNRQTLEQEVALLADRTDVCEEITRLKSHLQQFAQTLKSSEQVGKKLNFILQEINREVNTIGSKSMSAKITSEVIGLKEEVERVREQVQNVE